MTIEDPRRLLGALIDIGVSAFVFVAGVATIVALAAEEPISLGMAIGVMVTFWMMDAFIYAVPLALFRGSLGNLLTSRRVVDATTGQPLSVGRALLRYLGRRRVVSWYLSRWRAELERTPLYVDYAPVGDPTLAFGAAVAHGLRAPDPTASTVSIADRMVGSAVTTAS